MTIQQIIFDTMEQKHISQSVLAKATGISQSTISDWKNKNKMPSSDKIIAIAECLGVPVSYLLGVNIDDEIESLIQLRDIPVDVIKVCNENNSNSPTVVMNGNSFSQGYVNHTATADMFGNPDVASAYNSLSPTQKLEIQIEILKKADSNGEK